MRESVAVVGDVGLGTSTPTLVLVMREILNGGQAALTTYHTVDCLVALLQLLSRITRLSTIATS